jgi:hypothetical protein
MEDSFMTAYDQISLRKIAILASLPIAAFAIYIAWLVVPEVLRIVVPAVVENVVTH